MQFISETTNIKFMEFRTLGFLISSCVIAASLYMFFVATGPEKYSVDFLGGAEVVVKFEKAISIAEIRTALIAGGIDSAIVQAFEEGENDFSIRVKASKDKSTGKRIREALATIEDNPIDLRKEDYVGPIIGEQIKKDGIYALSFALIGILIYIAVRFEMRFAVGAICALVHDVIITTGVYVFSGREISAAVLAALLTIIGYSLNDTIIVYDRIRENLLKLIKKEGNTPKSQQEPLHETINRSINQTLSRTILTSLTTLFVVTTLWLLGGGAVEDLAFTLVIGVMVGTYSSVFIASPILMTWRIGRSKKEE